MGFNGYIDGMEENSERIYYYRAKRIENEIPTLCAIEKDCVQNIDYILEVVDEFYKDHPQYAEIRGFVKSIYYSGQRIEDWDINFFKSDEAIDENGYLIPFDDKRRDNILLKMIMSKVQKRQASLDRYCKIYRKDR